MFMASLLRPFCYILINQCMKVAAIDIETTGLNARYDKILAIAIVTEEKEIVIDTSQYSQSEMIAMMERLRDNYDVVIAHNTKFDASFIYYSYGVLFRNLYCTMLGSQIIKNGHKGISHNLIACLKEYLNITDIESGHKDLMRQLYINHIPGTPLTPEMKDYVLSDTKYLIPMWKSQMERVKRLELDRIIKLENALTPVLIKMELGGCLIDVVKWKNMLKQYDTRLSVIVEELDIEVKRLAETVPTLQGGIYTRPRRVETIIQAGLFGDDTEITTQARGSINYGSSQQVIEFIERVDGITLEAVGIDNINTYLNEHPETKLGNFLGLLLQHREYSKMISTYGNKFLAKLDENNYIHTNYSQCRAMTGRLASSNPNLQNIPNGEIREFFTAKPDHKMITCDMSGAEVSLAADFSEEPLLLNALLHGTDMHSELASVSFSIIFGAPVEVSNSDEVIEVKGHSYPASKLRKVHKSVTFAKFYKAGANRIYQTLASFINDFHQPSDRITVARKISSALDKKMPKLTKYLSIKIKTAQQQGFLRGALGRVRFFDEEVYGEAANYPIQNANAEAMKMALIMIDKHLETLNYGRLVLNIHDEVVVEVPTAHSQALGNKIQEIMAWSLSYFLSTLKGGASINIKDHWEK